MSISVDNSHGLRFTYDSRTIDLERVSAAWYRRSTLISSLLQDRAKQLGIDSERKVLQAALWDNIPESAWLNPPDRIRRAERKLKQLAVAQSVGFTVPDTIATNQWEVISGELPHDIIFKPSYPFTIFCDSSDPQVLYTTRLCNTEVGLPTEGNPYPGIWQPYLEKAREWRITVVGDDAFEAAIYTSDDAKDDWRKHQADRSAVEFRAEPFPDSQKEKCHTYLGKLGLKFGAFDFIESADGEITFLECNSNGQFGWLEDRLGLPITQAVADQLASIASSSK